MRRNMDKTAKIIPFPTDRGGCNRYGPNKGEKELAHDLLCIANYFDACADITAVPAWMRCMATEVRKVARGMKV